MNILFVHQNFPAQYRHLATNLAADSKNLVAAIGSQTARELPNVVLRRYEWSAQDVSHTHPFARRFDLECRRAERVLFAAVDLARTGFRPDVIMVHSGWGENLTLRAVFPAARIIVYCEYFYSVVGQDVNFDSEFADQTMDGNASLGLRNAAQLIGLVDADAALSPTFWQKSTYPPELQHKISVIHEGVATRYVLPDPNASVTTPSEKILKWGDEVLTYVARDLEPIRGYHVVMRALPRILKARPLADVVIVGGDKISYGAAPPPGKTWKQHFLAEVEEDLDMRRVHFVGTLPYDQYLSVLQISRVHLYFTYPFVLSWSFLEAMSAGCVVLAGDVPTTREVLDDRCGVLVPFHDSRQIAERAISILAEPQAYRHLGLAAREKMIRSYDTDTHSIPRLRNMIDGVMSR